MNAYNYYADEVDLLESNLNMPVLHADAFVCLFSVAQMGHLLSKERCEPFPSFQFSVFHLQILDSSGK